MPKECELCLKTKFPCLAWWGEDLYDDRNCLHFYCIHCIRSQSSSIYDGIITASLNLTNYDEVKNAISEKTQIEFMNTNSGTDSIKAASINVEIIDIINKKIIETDSRDRIEALLAVLYQIKFNKPMKHNIYYCIHCKMVGNACTTFYHSTSNELKYVCFSCMKYINKDNNLIFQIWNPSKFEKYDNSKICHCTLCNIEGFPICHAFDCNIINKYYGHVCISCASNLPYKLMHFELHF